MHWSKKYTCVEEVYSEGVYQGQMKDWFDVIWVKVDTVEKRLEFLFNTYSFDKEYYI